MTEQQKITFPQLYQQLDGLMLRDKTRFARRLHGVKKVKNPESQQAILQEMALEISQAAGKVLLREAARPAITYPENLPVSQKKQEILEAVRDHQVVIVAGETGSGKTTQLPKICMELGRGLKGLIGHTQPRRLAARTVANRIAEELQTEPGGCIGYKVRFSDHVSDNTMVKLMTDGILLAEIQQDRLLMQYDTIIIDEAHQSQSGESAKSLRRALIDLGVAIREYAEEQGKDESDVDVMDEYVSQVLGQGHHANQSFFAFTATPKGATLELFGTRDAETGMTRPFHVYSMRKAIEEGFILNVLANYTTIREAFQIVRTTEQNPELVEGAASKALFKYYKEHGYTIAQKTDIIMSNFLHNGRYQIDGKGKAMVVADSRANAVRYYFAIREYMKSHPQESAGCGVLVAFSGEVTLPDRPSEKPYTEANLNAMPDGSTITTDIQFRKAFHSSDFNILVVANKYQTGFDEPLLRSMYVDKRLADVTAVQTLSRLNRTTRGKDSTFVLDFENTAEDIKNAFLPYYEETTLIGSTDPNKVYDWRNKVHDLMLYSYEDVDRFMKFMSTNAEKPGNDVLLSRYIGLFNEAVGRYKEMEPDERYTARLTVRNFVRAYAFVTQLVRLHDRELFSEYLYAGNLLKLLPVDRYKLPNIEEMIRLEYANLKETFSGAILIDEKPPVFAPGNTGVKPRDVVKGTLQSIIDKVNERFDGKFSSGDKVVIEGIFSKFMADPEVKKYRRYAEDNSPDMFVRSLFPDKFKAIVTECFIENADAYDKLFNDPEFYQKVMEVMAQELYKSLRKDK